MIPRLYHGAIAGINAKELLKQPPIDNYIRETIYSSYDISEADTMKGEKEMPQLALTEAVFYILLSLQKPLHGYGIIQNVEELSKGRVKLAAGTLYGALNSLVDKGWIDALPENPESRKKEYVITNSGLNVLKEELARLTELVDNGNRLLGGN